MNAVHSPNPYLARQIALPQDHGSWVFLFSPLLIGLFAGGQLTLATPFLILGALAGFLIRQPVTVAVKTLSGRRPKREQPAALFWIGVYALFGLVAAGGLAWQGMGYLLLLAIPAAPIFAWHLWLVSRRQERRQAGVEILGVGVLALAAPAAYWSGTGAPDAAGWWLFGLSWLQAAASIVYAYLRLEQRGLPGIPDLAARLRLGWRAILYAAFNVLFTLACALPGWLPLAVSLPFALQLAETLYGSLLSPAVGFKPTRIGVRQLIVSSLFTLLFIIVWG